MKLFLALLVSAALAVTAAAVVLQPNETGTLECAGDELAIERQSITRALYSCILYTPQPTPTNTPEPVATNTPEPTPTNTPPAGLGITAWHAPGAHDGLNVHEHGDAPQAFFEQWSLDTFGHGIVYGGDEFSGAMERDMKHQAYKGIRAQSDAGGDVYLRYHAASNPMDRAAQYHSYEVYYRDTAGNISFWQGWYDTGDPNTDARCPRRNGPSACESQRPIMLVVDQTAWDQGIRGEQWYMFGSPNAGWAWDMGLTIINATTLYVPGENATAHDPSTWVLTGDRGLQRRSDGFWYLGRDGGGTNLTGWFCATPLGDVTSVGSQDCGGNGLPQYIAPTIGQDARDDGFGNVRISWLVQKQFSSGGGSVTVPN